MWPTGIASEEDIHGAIDNDNDDVKKEVELSIRQPWPFQALLMWPTGIASEEDIHGAIDNDNDDD